MRKLVGIVIIAFSVLLGLACAIVLQQEIIVANIVLWFISLPLYIFGQITRTSKSEFKYQGKRWIAIYLFFFFILPLLIYLYEFYSDLKETTFIDEKFIMYEPSSGMLGELSLGGFMILIFLFGARFLNPGLKRKGLLNSIIIGTVIFLIGFNYLMFSDYRGVHEEKGLISSNWKGERQMISYDELESVYLKPYVHYASLSNTSDETRFVWEVTFQPSHQKEVVYRFSMLTESGLEQTIAIKKLALENNIPVIIGEMNQETLKWFNLDLEFEKLEKERYYELFQVNYK
ncbi:hypothetical protein [Niallia sp.]|uniref:hypothetical protein n=1 Tax=Niallia sp. TaxID=2837523 RepID=UPI00289D6C46|nr:hypothetical protein [Niallia sp.]